MKKVLISIIVAVILITLLFTLKPIITGKSVNEEKLKIDEFAQCLTDAGAVMYGTTWCSHCQEQKKLFGKSFKNIDFVDCDKDSDKCSLAGVQGYPTWVINGESFPGKQSLNALGIYTGCNN
jgi:hypothetical protein